MKNGKQSSGETTRKRILIVDDHPMTRQGISQLLAREPDLLVCGEAADVAHAHAALRHTPPDLVLTDITMPDKSGLEFIREMSRQHPRVPLLVLSMHDESVYAERVLKAGARGYVMKTESGENLLAAVRQVLRGEIYVSKKISALLLDRIAGRRANREDATMSTLTDREFDVFQLIGQGLGTKEIAQRLHISGKTVETHRGHLKRKLKLSTRSELTSHAVRWAAAKQLI